jgi:ribonuclease P protein component
MHAARLRRTSDIATVRKTGRGVRDVAFIARMRPNDLTEMRLAVSAPRTVGISTVRNRARRRVREAFRHACAATNVPAQDIVVTVRREAISADFSALRAAADAALSAAARPR